MLIGKMYPSKGDLHVAPFTDDALFMEQTNKASFWYVKYILMIHNSLLKYF